MTNRPRTFWRLNFVFLAGLVVFLTLIIIYYMKVRNRSSYSFFTSRSRIRVAETWSVLHLVGKGLNYYQINNEGRFPETVRLSSAFEELASVSYDDISVPIDLSNSYDDGRPMLDRMGGILCPMDAWGHPILYFSGSASGSDDGLTVSANQRPVLRDSLATMPIIASAGLNGKWERGNGDDMFCGVSKDLARVVSQEALKK